MRVKGTSLRTRIEFVRRGFGEAAPEKLLEALSPSDRKAVAAALPGSWIPFSLATRVDETIAQVREVACQVSGAELCAYEVSWQT